MLASRTSQRLLLAGARQQPAPAARRLLATTVTWSNSFSFASPEADFSGCTVVAPLSSSFHSNNNNNNNLKERFFYSSQSTTVTDTPNDVPQVAAAAWSNTLSFASPESDFTSSNDDGSFYNSSVAEREREQQPGSFYTMAARPHDDDWSNTISFASPESDFTSPETTAATPWQQRRYPETLAEALRSPWACVVTRPTAPHTIVAVNQAWTDLCGYTANEVVGQSLQMIQGTLTNTTLAAATVQSAVQNNQDKKAWVDMYVVNYKKNGSPFTNHVSLKEVPLNEDEPSVRFLLGVLEPVDRAPLRMIF